MKQDPWWYKILWFISRIVLSFIIGLLSLAVFGAFIEFVEQQETSQARYIYVTIVGAIVWGITKITGVLEE